MKQLNPELHDAFVKELDKPIKLDDETYCTALFVSHYNTNGTLAINAFDKHSELLCTLTVNLNQSDFIDNDQFFIQPTEWAQKLAKELEKRGKIKIIDTVTQNYETYHLAQIIDVNFLKDED